MSAGDSSWIGRPVERLEDEALLRGDGRFCAAGDYAMAMAAVVLHVGESPPTGAAGHDNDERVAEARVAIGATVDRPTLLPAVSALVQVQALDAREAGAAAAESIDPIDGLHASAAYQRHVTGLLVERALLRAREDATTAAA